MEHVVERQLLGAIKVHGGCRHDAIAGVARMLADRNEPLLFASFNQRVAGLSPQISNLRDRVDVAMATQRAFLQDVAVDELQAQKQRLDTYTVQARFALAAIYDLSSTVGSTAP
jgi:hypothetical protein